MDNNESFEFTYCAPEQEEIRRIRDKYLPLEERTDKMELLRQLDAGVTRKGSAAALCVGILGTLTMGIGMCCCLVWADVRFMGIPLFFIGIVIGLIGIAGISAAYPVYTRITNAERERIAPQILKLTEELMQ